MNQSNPETIIFLGAGATVSLSMPQTNKMAEFFWNVCEHEDLFNLEDSKVFECFCNKKHEVALMAYVLDSGVYGFNKIDTTNKYLKEAFPNVSEENIYRTVSNLRKHYDWKALMLILKAKKGEVKDPDKCRDNFLQEVFTLLDVCLRDERGFEVYYNNETILLPLERIRSSYETLTLFINTMFACAWENLISSNKDKLIKYSKFFDSLARTMQNEALKYEAKEYKFDKPEFYRFSYSIVTTNFEPIFLWLIWNSHGNVNDNYDVRVGNPGRRLKLLMNFPNSLGMRKPKDELNGLSADIWFPCTEAVAQNVNNPKYSDDRIFRLGMYYPVHGMSNTRKCPKCGRLNLYMGDSWDLYSETLFLNGVINQFNWGQKARTKKENDSFSRGEYDALECHFCGEITHSYDNFMFMQTQLKRLPPSFIKEATDEALAVISKAKHIVLLGYSLPLDDAIWASLLSIMTQRKEGEKMYCSVVNFVQSGQEGWLSGKELEDYVVRTKAVDKESVRAIENAITIFGVDNVRAYVQGVPNVFGKGTVEDVKELLYPHR